jgi:hypothetical protein
MALGLSRISSSPGKTSTSSEDGTQKSYTSGPSELCVGDPLALSLAAPLGGSGSSSSVSDRCARQGSKESGWMA